MIRRTTSNSDRKIRRLLGRQRLGGYAVAGILATTGAGAGLEKCQPPPDVSTPISVNAEVIAIVNEQRAASGLAPLASNTRLVAAAETHSADQAGRDRMSHTGSNGSSAGDRITAAGYSWRSWAENVAAGYATAADVMNGWMNSPGHRNNILSSNATQIGVAAVASADGTVYWTMVLAAPA
jgi:uncharacterized protein YkwD